VTSLPSPDDIVYVPDTEDETRNWRFHGGWAVIGRVLVGVVEAQEKVWVSVIEFGAMTFEWDQLAQQQTALKQQFNTTHAGPR